MGDLTSGMNMQDVFKTLGMKSADLKALEKMIGPLPSSMRGGSFSATANEKRPSLEIEKSWQALK